MQAKTEVSHHDHDAEGNWKSVKPLVFVLDAVPEDDNTNVKTEKKKKKKTSITTKNFGAFVNIPAMKNTENLFLAWRCRSLNTTSLMMDIRGLVKLNFVRSSK